MCYINFIRGDLLSPPFENRKFMLGALIGAGASILGAKLNNDAIAKNNQRQVQLIHEQNSYNAPDQQVARMRQAGLNPYMMLGQINSGNQSSVASTESSDFNAFASNVNTAAQMVQQSSLVAAQVRDMNAEAAGKEIDNQTKQDLNLQQLEMLRSQVSGQSIVNNAAQYDLQYMKPAQLQQLQGNIDKISHDIALTMQKVGTESLNQEQIIKQIEHLGLDNKRSRAILPFVIRSAELENKEQQMRISTGYQNAFTNRLSAYAAQTSASALMMNSQVNKDIHDIRIKGGYYGTEIGILRQEHKSSYFDALSSHVDYLESKRSHEYNKKYFRSPINDRNWGRASSIIPFGPGYVRTAGSAYSPKPVKVKGFGR